MITNVIFCQKPVTLFDYGTIPSNSMACSWEWTVIPFYGISPSHCLLVFANSDF